MKSIPKVCLTKKTKMRWTMFSALLESASLLEGLYQEIVEHASTGPGG